MLRLLIVSLVCFFFASDASALDTKRLDSSLSEFENINGPASVIIIKPESGRVEYIYNPQLASENLAPGSLMKPLSAIVFLENSDLFDFDPYAKIKCTGKTYLEEKNISPSDFSFLNIQKDSNGHYLKCSVRDGHGDVDLSMAVSFSCNSYFLYHSKKSPYKFLAVLSQRFSFDKNSGSRIDGLKEEKPGESGGASYLLAAASAIGEGGAVKLSMLKISQIYSALLAGTPALSLFSGAKEPMEYSKLEIDPRFRRMVTGPMTRVVLDGTMSKIGTVNRKIRVIAGKTGTSTGADSVYSNQGWNVLFFEINGERFLMTVFTRKGTGSIEAMKLSRAVLDAL